MTISHDDINRSVGRVEGAYAAMEKRMDHLEKTVTTGFEKVEQGLNKIDQRLASIEAREAERKGAWKVVAFVASLVSACIAWVVNHFFGSVG